jgi:hypothetical protein
LRAGAREKLMAATPFDVQLKRIVALVSAGEKIPMHFLARHRIAAAFFATRYLLYSGSAKSSRHNLTWAPAAGGPLRS